MQEIQFYDATTIMSSLHSVNSGTLSLGSQHPIHWTGSAGSPCCLSTQGTLSGPSTWVVLGYKFNLCEFSSDPSACPSVPLPLSATSLPLLGT